MPSELRVRCQSWWWTGTLQAQQDRLLADLYGRGVHAYFDGQLEDSHKLLSEVIEQKTQDDRFIFRVEVRKTLGEGSKTRLHPYD